MPHKSVLLVFGTLCVLVTSCAPGSSSSDAQLKEAMSRVPVSVSGSGNGAGQNGDGINDAIAAAAALEAANEQELIEVLF